MTKPFKPHQKTETVPVFKVAGDANLAVGNIDCTGDVMIEGWARDGIVIRASGDIKINGGVEGTEIHAGGNVIINGGIQAHNRGLVSAGGTVESNYINAARVHSKQSVIVKESILHSEIFAEDRITALGENSLISGGMLKAGNRIEASSVGSRLASPTILELGAIPEIRDELTNIRTLLKSREQDRDQVQKAIRVLESNVDINALSSSEREKKLYHQYMALSQLTEEIDMLDRGEKHLASKVYSFGSPELVVSGSLFPGVEVTIKEATMRFTDEIRHVSIHEEKGEIVVVPLGNQ
jgi:uncharacterized protein (DUF342 family)